MMNEDVLQKCESPTFVNKIRVKSKRKYTKLCIYFGVIFLFYIKFLWYGGDWRGVVDIVPPKHHRPTRQLLSLVRTSAIDLENSQEDVSVTETSLSSRTTEPTTVETIAESVAATNTTQPIVAPWSNVSKDVLNCTAPAILQFPSDGLTRTQRQHGWIALHILLALYCFWLLAVVCDDYLLPAIELICQGLHLQADVVGATFMAIATSSPELFMNCIGTFVTQDDIGIGTIVGSSIFNLLAVPACCGLFVGQRVCLDWWPVSRDCLMYCMAVLALIGTLWDGKVMWYESLLLFVAYLCYLTVMFNNDKVARSARHLVSRYLRKLHLVRSYREVSELTPLIGHSTLAGSAHSINTCASNKNHTYSTQLYPSLVDIESYHTSMTQNDSSSFTATTNLSNGGDSANSADLVHIPWQRKTASWLAFLLRWPITFLLHITVPDSREHPRAKYFTFGTSILWIALISYVVAYAITVIGDTLSIPDSVMGLTILSAGMSVPEAVSSIIVAKQGQGGMGISNAIGSNTFDILLCLSVPWFIKAYFLPDQPHEMWVTPNSNGLSYSAIFLLAAVICLFSILLLNSFKLDRKVSCICAVLYSCFIVCAALIQLNVFFPVNLPVCEH